MTPNDQAEARLSDSATTTTKKGNEIMKDSENGNAGQTLPPAPLLGQLYEAVEFLAVIHPRSFSELAASQAWFAANPGICPVTRTDQGLRAKWRDNMDTTATSPSHQEKHSILLSLPQTKLRRGFARICIWLYSYLCGGVSTTPNDQGQPQPPKAGGSGQKTKEKQ